MIETAAPPAPSAAQPVKASRLDTAPVGVPFNVDAFVNDRANTPKQQYDQPEPPRVDEVLPGEPGAPAPGVVPGPQVNRKSAKFIIGMIDRLQCNGFALVASNEDPEVFRMTHAEKDELADYLEEGVAQGKFQVPWWLPFIVCMLLIGFANFKKAMKIKKEQKAKLDELLNDTNVGPAMSAVVDRVSKHAEQVLKERKAAQQASRPAPVKPPVEPGAQTAQSGVPLMITKKMREQLLAMGKTSAEIDRMTPTTANLFIAANQVPKPQPKADPKPADDGKKTKATPGK